MIWATEVHVTDFLTALYNYPAYRNQRAQRLQGTQIVFSNQVFLVQRIATFLNSPLEALGQIIELVHPTIQYFNYAYLNILKHNLD